MDEPSEGDAWQYYKLFEPNLDNVCDQPDVDKTTQKFGMSKSP